jgi:hypothetical protein
MAKAKHVTPCARCAALEAWIRKAQQLFTMIGEEWTHKPSWLDRQLTRAHAQCPIPTIPEEETHV